MTLFVISHDNFYILVSIHCFFLSFIIVSIVKETKKHIWGGHNLMHIQKLKKTHLKHKVTPLRRFLL